MAEAGAAPLELGTKSIKTLLKQYAVPSIIASTASSLYNMVDSVFIGHIPDVGAYAISGLAVTFPLMNLSVALGTLVGVGASTMVSVFLGQKNYVTANKVLANVLSLNTIIGLLFTIVALIFLKPILYFFGASENTIPFATDYMRIILVGNVITHLYFGLNNLVRASGNPNMAMKMTIFTVTSNAVLDPVFIYWLGMGIQGAALATVICQFLALCYTMMYFLDRNRCLHFPKGVFALDWKIAKSSMAIGMGPFLMNAAACIVSLFINQQLKRYGGDLAIGAYGIANRLTFLFVMIVMGFNHGMQPIAGYNYGAGQYKRVREVFVLTAQCAVIVTSVAFLASELFPGPAVSLFTSDAELKTLAVRGLRLMNSGFAFVGIAMVATTLFQCLGMVKTSIFLSLVRQLIILVPLVYALPLFLGETGVWISFPISDVSALLISLWALVRLFRKFRLVENGADPSILGSSVPGADRESGVLAENAGGEG